MELRGMGVSGGIAIGKAWQVAPRPDGAGKAGPAGGTPRPDGAGKAGPAGGTPRQEAQRLRAAKAEAARQLEQLAGQLAARAGRQNAAILEGQALMLEDPFLDERLDALLAAGQSAEAAVVGALQGFIDLFAAAPDELTRQRAADVADLRQRLLHVLAGREQPTLADAPAGSVAVVRELTPSLTAGLAPGGVAGVVAETGGATSHGAILARALGIPAVFGVPGALALIPAGSLAALDGGSGLVTVDPDGPALARLREEKEKYAARQALLKDFTAGPTRTADGVVKALTANIASPAEAAASREQGAEGVGLFRTEFLFMGQTPPGEEQQLAAYRQAAAAFPGGEVTIRTLDAGGDKQAPCLGLEKEENPALGCRGVRLCLARPELFLTQLRALARAGAGAPGLRVMLPLVTGVEELREARRLLRRAEEQLAAEGLAFRKGLPLGVMIETPAAALTADLLAKEADFFSIGTNDLTQYILAADRGNGAVAALCTPCHPAVLRAVRDTIRAAKAAHIPVGMCGEAAADPLLTPLLLAWGLEEFSVSPAAAPAVRRAIRLWSVEEASRLAEKAMACPDAASLRACLAGARRE